MLRQKNNFPLQENEVDFVWTRRLGYCPFHLIQCPTQICEFPIVLEIVFFGRSLGILGSLFQCSVRFIQCCKSDELDLQLKSCEGALFLKVFPFPRIRTRDGNRASWYARTFRYMG